MKSLKFSRNVILKIKKTFEKNTLNSLFRLVNTLPKLVGFSILKQKRFEPFWILHLGLLFYVYAVGNMVYQVKFAKSAEDFIKSFVNVSIFMLTANNSYWFLMKRPLLRKVLDKVINNDEMSQSFSMKKHRKLLSLIKKILLIFYGFNLTNEFGIYLPNRGNVQGDNYSMIPCFGIEPLTESPKREICQAILCTQELTIMIVVLNYQALYIILIAHTAAMYTLMADEMSALAPTDCEVNFAIKEKLANLIRRHSLTLGIIEDLKLLYSMPIGVNFGTNAVCICLFFYLPFREWVKFMPVLVYCFIVFFLYCFLCQSLINAAEHFEMAIYCCGWESFDLKEKKVIYLMLVQAQKPLQLLAADIIPVNIYTFASTLQGMYKFVTVVKF